MFKAIMHLLQNDFLGGNFSQTTENMLYRPFSLYL